MQIQDISLTLNQVGLEEEPPDGQPQMKITMNRVMIMDLASSRLVLEIPNLHKVDQVVHLILHSSSRMKMLRVVVPVQPQITQHC